MNYGYPESIVAPPPPEVPNLSPAPWIESLAASDEIVRIAVSLGGSALRGANGEPIDMTIICNEHDEPLAVLLRKFWNPDSATWPMVDEAQSRGRRSGDSNDFGRMEAHFPMVKDRLLPSNVLQLLDLVVQGALDNDEVLASDVTEWTSIRNNRDTGRHIDDDRPDDESDGRLITGLNVLMETEGTADVMVGRLRSFKDVVAFREVHVDPGPNNVDPLSRWRELGEPNATFTFEPGDALVFRGGPDIRGLLLPNPHGFHTAEDSEPRVRELFTPSAAPAAIVGPVRRELAERHGFVDYLNQAQLQPA